MEGEYDVQLITNPGLACADSTTLHLSVPEVPVSHLYIPNTFTPNGDGVNDNFRIFGYGKCGETDLKIYNRWGLLMYQTKNLADSWDGKYNGEVVEAGLYSYLIKANGEFKQGTIVVMY
jgi:gliding motility-associated-like protein